MADKIERLNNQLEVLAHQERQQKSVIKLWRFSENSITAVLMVYMKTSDFTCFLSVKAYTVYLGLTSSKHLEVILILVESLGKVVHDQDYHS